MDRIIKALVLSPFVSQKMASFTVKPNKEDLRFLRQLIEAGKVAPVIDRTYPLPELPEAIRAISKTGVLVERSSSPCPGRERDERACDLADQEVLRRCMEY